ncbi:MAG: SAM-dependent methyltransferase [Pseudomonadota bacterium]
MTQFNNMIDLPEPDKTSTAHSHVLMRKIEAEIKRSSGFIGFDEFMRLALYEPGLGYYSAGLRKFGQEGDFITAPEISSIFSRCLARQCKEIIQSIENCSIFELGAGTAVMAADILLALQEIDALPEQYFILEVSADLKQRQQALLRERVPFFYEHIKWLDQLPEETFSGIVLANEVIDALPVKRFIKQDHELFEYGVAIADDKLIWQTAEPLLYDNNDQNILSTAIMNNLVDGYTSEINLSLGAWLSSFADKLEQGLLLFLDYGYPAKEYYHPERTNGTLLCHYQHRAHDDPFYFPGLQDITASVDFTRLAENAYQAGLNVAGYTTQSAFLIACGLEEVAQLNDSNHRRRAENANAIRTLTLPAEMGERIKVMALTKNYEQPLLGFSFMDQRVRL